MMVMMMMVMMMMVMMTMMMMMLIGITSKYPPHCNAVNISNYWLD